MQPINDTSLWERFWLNRTYSIHLTFIYQHCREMSGDHSNGCSLLSLGAVAVHAPIRRLPAGLAGHPVSHLHSQPCLSAPLDGAPQLLAPRLCRDKRDISITPWPPAHLCYGQRTATPCCRNSRCQIADLHRTFHLKHISILVTGEQSEHQHKCLLKYLCFVTSSFSRQTAYTKPKSSWGGNQIYSSHNLVSLGYVFS